MFSIGILCHRLTADKATILAGVKFEARPHKPKAILLHTITPHSKSNSAAQAVYSMRFHVMHRAAAVLTALTMLTFPPQAQSLPPPAKTVFKCEENGKVVYSDSPCLGAKTVDVEPPRGVSRLSGQERVGSAVQQERLREHIADAMRPLTGMNPKQYETFGRRQKLPADTQRECQRLDGRIPLVEAEERQASGQGLAEIQLRLLGLRKRFRELAC